MKPLRVLVVEDEAMIAMLYAEVLSSLGHEACAIATTEDEAVEAASSCKPDLMIVDQHLQEGSGADAVKRILATTYVPCIFVSGDSARGASSSAAAQICLQKPFNEAQLTRAIAEALRHNLSSSTTAP